MSADEWMDELTDDDMRKLAELEAQINAYPHDNEPVLKHCVEWVASRGMPARDGVPSGVAQLTLALDAAYWEARGHAGIPDAEAVRVLRQLVEATHEQEFDHYYQEGLSRVMPRLSDVI